VPLLFLAEKRPEYAAGPDEEEEGISGGGKLLLFPTSVPASPFLREEDLALLWEGQRFPRDALKTRRGEPLQVVHRGTRNGGAGPDFTNAIIADASARLLKGDVELHVRSSDFRAHGHHLDPRYNCVVLHVVFEDDTGEDTLLQCGRHVAVVALSPWVAQRSEQLRLWLATPALWREPCRSAVETRGTKEIEQLLERLGCLRFRQKQARYAAELRRQGGNQALYEGLMRALGYSRNQEAFACLARLLPYETLKRALDEEGVAGAEALAFGCAGLLPGQRGVSRPDDAYAAELERRWAGMHFASVPQELWRLDGLRPENQPARRLAGMVRILSRWPGLVASLQHVSAVGGRGGLRQLLSGWQAPADGYWREHYDLGGRPATTTGALVGPGRALELLINVVLPFAAAWGEANSVEILHRRAVELFRQLPRSGSYGATRFLENTLRPALAGQGKGACRTADRPALGRAGMACFQQGLLYLHHQYCSRGECSLCPLSNGGTVDEEETADR